MEVQDALSYLRMIASDDDAAFKRVINTPRRKFGRARMAALELLREDEAELSGAGDPALVPLYAVLKANLDHPAFRGSGARGFVEFVEEMRELRGKLQLTELVRYATERSGYEKYIRELGDEERLDNLTEFKRIADEFERSFGEEVSLTGFLHQAALQSAEHGDRPRDAVKLMTIHASKGLEFPSVFVLGFTEGVFPSAKSIEQRKKAGLEEERRLCYVAMTRAEKHLFIMDSEGVSQGGIKKLPSRFLREIGEQNYTRIGVIDDQLDLESREYSARLDGGLTVAADPQFKVGDEVTHHVFGKGTVEGIDEKFGSLTVRFEKLGMPRSISRDYFKRTHDLPDSYPQSSKEASALDGDILRTVLKKENPPRARRERPVRDRVANIKRIEEIMRMIEA